MQNVYNKDSFDNSIEVNNYPWGFRLKTKVRYWIETTKRGDRFVKCTLNPKTGNWCAEKKSTYDAVMVMTTDEKDNKTFVSHKGLSVGWSDAVQVAKFEHSIDKSQLSKRQLAQICKCKAMNEVNKHVSWEIKPGKTYNLSDPVDLARMRADANSPEELKAKKEQEDIKAKLANYANHLYKKCVVKNNLA